MLTANDIYGNEYLRARAEMAVKDSLAALTATIDRQEFASMALSDAERAGCEDMEYLDYLYLQTQSKLGTLCALTISTSRNRSVENVGKQQTK